MQYSCNADTGFSHHCHGSCTEHPNNKITSSQIHNSHQELFWFTLCACKVHGLRGREEFCHKLLQSQVIEVVKLKGHLCTSLLLNTDRHNKEFLCITHTVEHNYILPSSIVGMTASVV